MMHSALLLLAISHLSCASLSLTEFNAPPFSSSYRTLKAAKRHRDILARSDEIFLGQEVELAYAEHDRGETVMSAQVRLEADWPTLLLEDFDHHLERVECIGSKMTVTVRSAGLYSKAKDACSSLVGGLLISSHHTCGDEGAHTVYRVMNLTFFDSSHQIEFDLKESIIEKEFRTVTIDFGQTDEHYVIHRHKRLLRRVPADRSRDPTRTAVGRPTGVSVFPTESVVNQIEETKNVTNLMFEQINTTFFGGNLKKNPILLGCANCSTKGELITTSASFRLDLGAWFEGKDDDPVKTGFVQFELNGFEMSIGLKAVPTGVLKRENELLEFLAFGFKIPKIGSFGVTIALAYFVDVKVQGAVELGFGFDVKVPNSRARLDVAEMQDSAIEGFGETEVTLKPLSANVSNLEFSIVGGLKPKITAGLEFLGGGFSGGPYVSLPQINMTATQMSTDDVGANCTAGSDSDVKFKDAFQNLTHIDYSLGIAAGLGLQLIGLDLSQDLWSKSLVNATQCLAYQTSGPTKGLAFAVDVLESMTHTPTPTGTGSRKPSNAVRHVPQFHGENWLGVFGIVPAVIAVLL